MGAALWKGAGAAVALGIAGLCAWSAATGWHPSSASYPWQGIDLGEDPGSVEWGSIRAAGADFAYLVATSGADRRDPAFEANWAALPEAGLRRGAVHLYSLCQSAREQANAFNTFVPRADDALPPALAIDLRADCTARPTRAALIVELRRFLAMVEAHTGKPMLLRIGRAAEAEYRIAGAIDRPVWVAGNFVAPGYAGRPWRIWRASNIRRVDGIAGAVNWDVVTR